MILDAIRAYFTSLFFHPDANTADSPHSHDVRFEEVQFRSVDNRMLHGYFFSPHGPAQGTVIHCHGNTGNITGHFSLTFFLLEAGYNVLCFDYGGYGKSQGKPTPEVLIDDTLAALIYAKGRADVDPKKIALFGQSLGGVAAAGAMARDLSVKCLVLEGTFTSYQEMAWASSTGRCLFFLVPFVIPQSGPLYDLPQIAPRPVLIVHGTEDAVVPVKFAPRLHEAAPKHSTLVVLDNFGHLTGPEDNTDYKRAVLTFLQTHLI